MMRFHSDWTFLEKVFDCSIRERFLMAVRSLDNPKAVTPFLLETNRGRYGLFMHVEKGNVEAANLPREIRPIYYQPYFTFEESEQPPYVNRTLTDAIENCADGEPSIAIDWHTPMSISAALSARFTIAIDGAPPYSAVTLRKAPCAETMARLGRSRTAAAIAARRLLDKSTCRDRLLPYFDREDDKRFTMLAALLEEADLAGVVVSSTLNAQEIAGVPVGGYSRPLAVIYAAGESHAWVMEGGSLPDGETYSNAQAALTAVLPSGRIGVEVEDLSLGMSRILALETRDYLPADNLLRRWRDQNTLPDLGSYVVATRTTRAAIDAALDFAADAIRRRTTITELNAYAVYLKSMRDFAAAAMPGVQVRRTLTNFHSGSRTIFPANAAPYPIDATINTLKIDAGCLLFDADGFLLSCSDIARTLPLSEAAASLYAELQRCVRTVIRGIAAGRSGEAIHTDGVNALWGRSEGLKTNPLFFDFNSPRQDYARDVGHLLGKNNLAHLRFALGDENIVGEGMIACCEYQWPVQRSAIAYEDSCLVTAAGGLNLTSDEE